MSTFLHHLWAWAQRLPAPTPELTPMAPVAPAQMRQDQFEVAPNYAEQLQAEAETERQLLLRLVTSNNAFVTRNYGWGPVLVHYDSTVPDLTAQEMTALAKGEDGVGFR